MEKAANYRASQSQYYTESEQRKIAEIATTQGAISGTRIKMSDLFGSYFRMVFYDSFDMAMLTINREEPIAKTQPTITSPDTDAEALVMANRALEIIENGSDKSAEYYIGTGTAVHNKAIEYLPLVLEQRQK